MLKGQLSGLMKQAQQMQENMQKAQEDINDTIREFGDEAKRVFSGILDDVRAGASAIDIMKNAVDKLASSLSNKLLDNL